MGSFERHAIMQAHCGLNEAEKKFIHSRNLMLHMT